MNNNNTTGICHVWKFERDSVRHTRLQKYHRNFDPTVVMLSTVLGLTKSLITSRTFRLYYSTIQIPTGASHQPHSVRLYPPIHHRLFVNHVPTLVRMTDSITREPTYQTLVDSCITNPWCWKN